LNAYIGSTYETKINALILVANFLKPWINITMGRTFIL
jgi:hypothetical protein